MLSSEPRIKRKRWALRESWQSDAIGCYVVEPSLDFNMYGTSQATAGFQDSDVFQKAIKICLKSRAHFECDFSPFRIQPCSA